MTRINYINGQFYDYTIKGLCIIVKNMIIEIKTRVSFEREYNKYYNNLLSQNCESFTLVSLIILSQF